MSKISQQTDYHFHIRFQFIIIIISLQLIRLSHYYKNERALLVVEKPINENLHLINRCFSCLKCLVFLILRS